MRLNEHPALHPARRPASCCRRSSPTGRCCRGSLLVTLRTTFRASLLAVARRRRAGGAVHPVAAGRILALPYAVILQVTPIVAIAPLILIYLPQHGGAARLRLDRGVLPGAVQHHARPATRSTTISRPVPALRRLALAGAVPAQAAGGAALFPRRPEDRRRPVADRRGGRRVRRRHGRRRLGPRLPHPRGRLPAQHPAHVRGAAAALGRRHRDLLRALAAVSTSCCAAGTKARSARESDQSRGQAHRNPERRHDGDNLDQSAMDAERQHRRDRGERGGFQSSASGSNANQRSGPACASSTCARTAHAARTRPRG